MRCPREMWNAIQLAVTELDEQRIPYALIGTAALAAHGVSVPVPDADLMVEKEPQVPADRKRNEVGSNKRLSVTILGQTVDYIIYEEKQKEFQRFLSEPTIVIDGVRVATIATVMAIKEMAGRAKDLAHRDELEPKIAALLGAA